MHSPLLYTLLTHDYIAKRQTNHTIKRLLMTLQSWGSNNNETVYREELSQLELWCKYNNHFYLNVMKETEEGQHMQTHSQLLL